MLTAALFLALPTEGASAQTSPQAANSCVVGCVGGESCSGSGYIDCHVDCSCNGTGCYCTCLGILCTYLQLKNATLVVHPPIEALAAARLDEHIYKLENGSYIAWQCRTGRARLILWADNVGVRRRALDRIVI